MSTDIFNDSLIHKMLDETISGSDELSVDYHGDYYSKTSCIHLKIAGSNLEFPKGFGPFTSYKSDSLWSAEINNHADSDLLLNIFNKLTGENYSKIIIYSDQGKVQFKLFKDSISLPQVA